MSRTTGRTARAALGLGLALAALLGAAGPATSALASAPANPAGLYGSQDPTYDGVYRQSLAVLAQLAAGTTPAPAAVAWLTGQQCPDGGFEAFRANPAVACAAPSSSTYSGADSNSTALAVQALVALKLTAAADRGLQWLTAHHSADGGWAYYPDGAAGNASDANSTAVAWSAFTSAGLPLPTSPAGHTPSEALLALQVGCSGAAADQGAFTYAGTPNDFASVQATLAVAGGFLPVPAGSPANDTPTLTCPGGATDASGAAAAGAGYVANRLLANGGGLPDPSGSSGTDYGSTANAVLALESAGHGASAAQAALRLLAAHQAVFTTAKGADLPGSLALLVLAAVAGGQDPHAFGGSDLVARLTATITPAAAVAATSSPSASVTTQPVATQAPAPTLPDTGSSPAAGWTAALGVLLLLAGLGLVRLTGRRPRA